MSTRQCYLKYTRYRIRVFSWITHPLKKSASQCIGDISQQERWITMQMQKASKNMIYGAPYKLFSGIGNVQFQNDIVL